MITISRFTLNFGLCPGSVIETYEIKKSHDRPVIKNDV
jgi:hypothetical protein